MLRQIVRLNRMVRSEHTFARLLANQPEQQQPAIDLTTRYTESVEALNQFGQNQISLLHTTYQQLTRPRAARFVHPTAIQTAAPHTPDRRQKRQRMMTESEKRINRALPIVTGSLLWSTLCSIFAWPLGILSVPGTIYATYPIYRNAYTSLRYNRHVHVHTLFTITAITCVTMGFYSYYSLAAFFYVVSRKLLIRIKDDSHQNLVESFSLQPHFAWLLMQDGTEVRAELEDLRVGDVVVIHTSEIVPVDGVIIDGLASIDQQALTGEAQPAEKGPGDPVLASTIVLAGRIQVLVERAGEETAASQIALILSRTADAKADMQLRAEKLADKTVIPMLTVAAISVPLLGLLDAAAVINSHFGYRVSVIAPISILIYFRLMSQRGILVKDGCTLDLLTQVDTVVFDKTGTLTEEQPRVGCIYACAPWTEEEVLSYAATAETRQTHLIARAIVQAARQRKITSTTPDESQYAVGYGICVTVGGRTVRVGSHRYMHKEALEIPPAIQEAQQHAHDQGYSLVMVAVDDQVVGAIELHPTIRPEVRGIVQALKQCGIKETYIISGDHATPTRRLAQSLGIDHYVAETLPQEKAAIIEQLQNEGKVVCYIGDGINDAIALKKAHVSMSLRGASTIATDTAQIVMMDGSLKQLVRTFEFAREFDATMKWCFLMILFPTVVGTTGVFLLNFGLPHTILIKQIGLVGGLSCAMYPLMYYHMRRRFQAIAQRADRHEAIALQTLLRPGQ